VPPARLGARAGARCRAPPFRRERRRLVLAESPAREPLRPARAATRAAARARRHVPPRPASPAHRETRAPCGAGRCPPPRRQHRAYLDRGGRIAEQCDPVSVARDRRAGRGSRANVSAPGKPVHLCSCPRLTQVIRLEVGNAFVAVDDERRALAAESSASPRSDDHGQAREKRANDRGMRPCSARLAQCRTVVCPDSRSSATSAGPKIVRDARSASRPVACRGPLARMRAVRRPSSRTSAARAASSGSGSAPRSSAFASVATRTPLWRSASG